MTLQGSDRLAWLCLLLVVFGGCRSRSVVPGPGDKINLTQDVTQRRAPEDSVFRHFETTWQKFIDRKEELTRPVLTSNQKLPESWEPVIVTDCVRSPESGDVTPQVELTWQSGASQKPFRFDIALHYKGFEKDYYTSAFPVAAEKRFSLPSQSKFLQDTAAVLLTGPPLFPRIVSFRAAAVTTPKDAKSRAGAAASTVRNTLRIQDLGSGLSYRIRMCTFDKAAWTPTKEIVFTTPLCPRDDFK
jgi:hypothetical protein